MNLFAVVVPQDRMPADVVTMRSRLVLKDVESGARREVVLVYPEEERAHVGQVSVHSPVGVALLGLSEGALVEWPLPSGRTAVVKVESVQYQPEAAEEFHLGAPWEPGHGPACSTRGARRSSSTRRRSSSATW